MILFHSMRSISKLDIYILCTCSNQHNVHVDNKPMSCNLHLKAMYLTGLHFGGRDERKYPYKIYRSRLYYKSSKALSGRKELPIGTRTRLLNWVILSVQLFLRWRCPFYKFQFKDDKIENKLKHLSVHHYTADFNRLVKHHWTICEFSFSICFIYT